MKNFDLPSGDSPEESVDSAVPGCSEAGQPQHPPQPLNVANLPDSMYSVQEEILFNYEFRVTLRELEMRLHTAEDTKFIVMETARTGCNFYKADWCGILIADRNTGIWSAKVWYNSITNRMSETLIGDSEFFEDFPHWVEALDRGIPIVIPDVEEVKNVCPAEYASYCRFQVKNVIGAPFGENPTGFLVVKNARKFKTYPDMAQMLAFVGLSQYYLGEFINDTGKAGAEAKKVRFNLFGTPSIVYRGTKTSFADYKAPMAWKLLLYLLFSNRPKSALEIAGDLCQDDIENQAEHIRSTVYRIRDRLAQKIPDRMIRNDNGYQLNPELDITTDAGEMEELWKAAQAEEDVFTKVDLLKKAVELYQGEIFKEYADEEWLNPHVNHYAVLYVEIVKALLETLLKEKDYPCIQEYAGKALHREVCNVDVYYSLIVALRRAGASAESKRKLLAAKEALTPEEYQKLEGRLNRRGK